MALWVHQRDFRPEFLQDFYQLLVLLRIFGPSVGPRTQISTRNQTSIQSAQTPLRTFLNRLSYLCDYKAGGKTVSAIALESKPECIMFWLVTYGMTLERSRAYLEQTLAQLKNVSELSASALYNLEKKICNDSIEFAVKKVHNYTTLLVRYKEKCNRFMDPLLRQDLSRLSEPGASHSDICAAADRFRDTESYKRLSQIVSETPSPSDWSYLRHYIGRLGSWHRASRTVVQFARSRPEIFRQAKIGALETPQRLSVPLIDYEINLKTVIERLYSPEEQEELGRNIETAQRRQRTDFNKEFCREYGDKNFEPQVHAEVMLLEHFHNNERVFVDNDKYVGCSKPSCYCCGLYFQYHPGGFSPRPTHGNAWKKWQSPLHCCEENRELNQSILLQMIDRFRVDLKARLRLSRAERLIVPDSNAFTFSATRDEREEFEEEYMSDI